MIWPAHVRALAEAFCRGEADVIDPLHDAMIELGYPATAAWHFSNLGGLHMACTPGQGGCLAVTAILFDKDIEVVEDSSEVLISRRRAMLRRDDEDG